VNRSRLVSQVRITVGYLPPHRSVNSPNRASASSAVGAVQIDRSAGVMCCNSLRLVSRSGA
jgi:hypothetical protein